MEELPMLEVIDIHKWYGKVHAVNGVSFIVGKGEIIGLIGDNGAGKSTLVKVLAGYHQPDKGEILMEGNKVNITSPACARALGIETVYQERALVETMSLARNFYMGREPTKSLGFLDKRKMSKCLNVVNELGLSISSADYLVANLSGGQRQGIAIGRAMYFKAKIVLLDEPTTALSVKEVNKVLNLVLEFKKANISVVFITHNIQQVYEIADRFIIMENGKKIKDIAKDATSIKDLTSTIVGD